MSMLRSMFGATLGAAVAGLALRVRVASREQDASLSSVLADLPGLLSEDATRLSDAARRATQDGRDAANQARIDFDEQVVSATRRTKGNDD